MKEQSIQSFGWLKNILLGEKKKTLSAKLFVQGKIILT